MDDLEPPPHLRLLIADDNPDAAELLALVMGQAGHTVHIAHDGHAALALAQRLRPDVLVLDVRMPGMNGHVVARRLRECLPDARMLLLALTGQGSAEDKAEARAAGFHRHFTKPADVHELLACIARWREDNGPQRSRTTTER